MASTTAVETRAREARELERQKAWRDQASKALSAMKAEEGTGPVNVDELEDDDLDKLPLGAEEGPDGGTMLVPGGSPLPTLRVLPQGISRKRLEQAIRDLQLPVVIARDVDEADVVMTLRNEYKQKTPMLRDAEDRAMPIYVLKSNTIPQMQSSLTSIFSLEIDPREAAMRETEDAIEAVLSVVRGGRAVAPERLHPAAPAPAGRAGQPGVAVARARAVPAGQALSGRGAQRLAVTEPLGLRGGLRRLSSGLIAYGVIGLAVAAIGFGALVWVNGRVGTLRAEVATTNAQEAATMDVAANVLQRAATTAQTVTVTVDQTAQAVSAATATITETRSDLTALEAQLRSFNILGAAPLSSAADAVSRIATSMEGLDTQLPIVAASLDDNRATIAANATSLGQLGDATAALAARLRAGVDRGLARRSPAADLGHAARVHRVVDAAGARGARAGGLAAPRAASVAVDLTDRQTGRRRRPARSQIGRRIRVAPTPSQAGTSAAAMSKRNVPPAIRSPSLVATPSQAMPMTARQQPTTATLGAVDQPPDRRAPTARATRPTSATRPTGSIQGASPHSRRKGIAPPAPRRASRAFLGSAMSWPMRPADSRTTARNSSGKAAAPSRYAPSSS